VPNVPAGLPDPAPGEAVEEPPRLGTPVKGKWRANIRPMATRLAVREYLPFAAITAGWGLMGLAIGHADLVRLLAATSFIQSIRAFCTMEVTQALSDHVVSERAIYKKSRKLALRIDLIALAVCLVAVALLALFLDLRGMEKAAIIVAISAIAIPARNPGAILVAKRDRNVMWRIGSAVGGLLGGALVFAFGLGWASAAAFAALKPWFGLAAVRRFGPRKSPGGEPPAEALRFHDAASRTESTARRRLSYRLMRSFFSVALGPFGTLLARTGRGMASLDRKLARLIPRNRTGMLLVALGTAAAGIALLLTSREPSAFLGAAAFARIAASAGASLLWWNYAADHEDDDDDDDS
jgi:hypothetical protein